MADDEVLQLTLVHGQKTILNDGIVHNISNRGYIVAKSYGGVLGPRKYPVELLIKEDGGPTVEDLANFAAQVAEVPRGSQRLIFKGSLFLVRFTYNPRHLLCIRVSTLFVLIKILPFQARDSAVILGDKILKIIQFIMCFLGRGTRITSNTCFPG